MGVHKDKRQVLRKAFTLMRCGSIFQLLPLIALMVNLFK
jgi:hypothetical protein